MEETLPRLAAPVERTVTGAAPAQDTGVGQSIWGGIQWKDIPFADEGDE